MQRHEAQDWDELRPRGTYDDEYLHEDLPELAEAVASPFATCRRNRKVLERLNALVTRADPGSRVLIMARRVYQAGLVDPGAEKRLVEGYRSARLVELGVLQADRDVHPAGHRCSSTSPAEFHVEPG